MKIGIVGYQSSGKSSLFHWLSGVEPDPALAHRGQSTMVPVPDERVEGLAQVYQPKKITLASLELVDTPGLSKSHEGNATRLGLIREAGCLVVVIKAYGDSDPWADLSRFDEDLLLADLEIVTGRIERLRESVKKPKPNRQEELALIDTLTPLAGLLESGKPLHQAPLTEDQQRAIRSFSLLTEKPRLTVLNLADDDGDAQKWVDTWVERGSSADTLVAVPVGLQLELALLSTTDREDMVREMGLVIHDRDPLIRRLLEISGQTLFFTAGDKEVRTWLLPQGESAVQAAGNIHTDMARGFIRAEVMRCEDLFRLGSEREVKAQKLMRQEPKDYVIQDGDVVFIKFNV